MSPPTRGRRRPDPLAGGLAGAAGGLAGSVAMMTFQALCRRWVDLPVEPGDAVAADALADWPDRPEPDGPDPSALLTARILARRGTGRDIPAAARPLAGRAFHLAFGAGLGGLYGLLAEYVPAATLGAGLPFGALQMLAADELAVPALGLSEPPARAPASGHLTSLAAHSVYGVVAEMIRRRLRRAA